MPPKMSAYCHNPRRACLWVCPISVQFAPKCSSLDQSDATKQRTAFLDASWPFRAASPALKAPFGSSGARVQAGPRRRPSRPDHDLGRRGRVSHRAWNVAITASCSTRTHAHGRAWAFLLAAGAGRLTDEHRDARSVIAMPGRPAHRFKYRRIVLCNCTLGLRPPPN
jgi:hypothetical protein